VDRFFTESEVKAWEQWSNSSYEDFEGRERIYRELTETRKFRRSLELALSTRRQP
jgi:hypothetical protein